MITAPTVLIILIVGFVVTYCIYRSDSKIKEVTPTNLGVEVEVGSSEPLPQAWLSYFSFLLITTCMIF